MTFAIGRSSRNFRLCRPMQCRIFMRHKSCRLRGCPERGTEACIIHLKGTLTLWAGCFYQLIATISKGVKYWKKIRIQRSTSDWVHVKMLLAQQLRWRFELQIRCKYVNEQLRNQFKANLKYSWNSNNEKIKFIWLNIGTGVSRYGLLVNEASMWDPTTRYTCCMYVLISILHYFLNKHQI